jgi:hypothetical protein
MEEIKPLPDTKEPPSEEEKIDTFLIGWRNSGYYKFVMEIINNELNAEHLKAAMAKALEDDRVMTNDEIGELARIEFQANLRIQNIKEAIE